MAAPSPTLLTGARVSYAISAGGKPLDSSVQVISIDIWTGVNKLPKARLVLSDGSAADENFPLSETSALIPGAALQIALGYDGTNTSVFAGVIYRQGLDIPNNGPTRLVVEATDQAMAMSLARHNAIYQNLTDSQVMEKLIGAAGLGKSVTATSAIQPSIVQYYCTDWDLLVTRAQVNGMLVIVDAGKVTVAPPDTGQPPVLTLTFGESILEFRADMDAASQFSANAIQSFAWDPATQTLAQSGEASSTATAPGNLSTDDLAKVFGIAQYPQQTGGSLAAADLTTWSSAELLKTRLAKIRGEVRFQGSALVKTGAMVTLAGLGSRFNGNAYGSGLHHSVAEGLWRSTLEIGLSPLWFAATAPAIAAPGASGQLPPISNLQTGIVQQIHDDPDGEYRVLVSLPLLQAGGTLGIWARLSSFYAGTGIGAEFYPEIGAEVVVGFMNDDPRFPIILGSLYSKKNPPPVPPPDGANNQKSIVTRSKLRLDFFEDKKAVEINTPGGHSIRLDDDAKTLIVKDVNGNKLALSANGITLDSIGNLAITAKGNISVSAQGNLALKADANVTLDGLQIQAKAQTSFAAQGNAEAKLTASGVVTIQGALVKIN